MRAASIASNLCSRQLQLPQLPYRQGVVYGPIQSRRVGWSLGVNLLGSGRRVCGGGFDCVYCQFPRPNPVRHEVNPMSRLLRAPEILEEIESGILEKVDAGVHFDSVSFVGNGDPSAHPDLLEIVRFTRALLGRLGEPACLSIFTNAAPYLDDQFLEALRAFDQRLIKLDAADHDTLRQINGPRVRLDLDEMTRRLALLDGVIIQTMVVSGRVDNRASILQPRYVELAERAGATEIQLATIDKRPATHGVQPVTEPELRALAGSIQHRTTVPVVVYFQDCPSAFPDATPPARLKTTGVNHA